RRGPARRADAGLQRLHADRGRHLPLLGGRAALRAHRGASPSPRSPLADLELLRPDARGARQLDAAALLRVTTEPPLGSGPLGLETRLVVPDERADVVGQVEELQPLLLVERHREAPEPVDREPSLLAHLEGHAATRAALEPLVLRAQPLDLRLGVV